MKGLDKVEKFLGALNISRTVAEFKKEKIPLLIADLRHRIDSIEKFVEWEFWHEVAVQTEVAISRLKEIKEIAEALSR